MAQRKGLRITIVVDIFEIEAGALMDAENITTDYVELWLGADLSYFDAADGDRVVSVAVEEILGPPNPADGKTRNRAA